MACDEEQTSVNNEFDLVYLSKEGRQLAVEAEDFLIAESTPAWRKIGRAVVDSLQTSPIVHFAGLAYLGRMTPPSQVSSRRNPNR